MRRETALVMQRQVVLARSRCARWWMAVVVGVVEDGLFRAGSVAAAVKVL